MRMCSYGGSEMVGSMVSETMFRLRVSNGNEMRMCNSYGGRNGSMTSGSLRCHDTHTLHGFLSLVMTNDHAKSQVLWT